MIFRKITCLFLFALFAWESSLGFGEIIRDSSADSAVLAPLSRPPSQELSPDSETPDSSAFLSPEDIRELRAKRDGNTRLLLEAILDTMGWRETFPESSDEASFALHKNPGSPEEIALSPIPLNLISRDFRHYSARLAGEIFLRFGSEWSENQNPENAIATYIQPLVNRVNNQIKVVYQWTGYQPAIGTELKIVKHSDRFAYFTLHPDESTRTLTFDLELCRLSLEKRLPPELLDIMIRHELIHSLFVDVGSTDPRHRRIAGELLALAVTILDLQLLSDEKREAVLRFVEEVEAQTPSRADPLSAFFRNTLAWDLADAFTLRSTLKTMMESPFFQAGDSALFGSLTEPHWQPLVNLISEWAGKLRPAAVPEIRSLPPVLMLPTEPAPPAPIEPPLIQPENTLPAPREPLDGEGKNKETRKGDPEEQKKRRETAEAAAQLRREQAAERERVRKEEQKRKEEEERVKREEALRKAAALKEQQLKDEQALREREGRLAKLASNRSALEAEQDRQEMAERARLDAEAKTQREAEAQLAQQQLGFAPFGDSREAAERINGVSSKLVEKLIGSLSEYSFLSRQKQLMLSRKQDTDLKHWIQAWSKALDLLEYRLSKAICDKRNALHGSVMGGPAFHTPNDSDKAGARKAVQNFMRDKLAPFFQDYIRERWTQDLRPRRGSLDASLASA